MQSVKAAIDSLYDWWNRAGVDLAYRATPQSLLPPVDSTSPKVDQQPSSVIDVTAPVTKPEPTTRPSPSPEVFPAEYNQFMQWLAQPENQVERQGTGPLILPQGELNPDLMFIIGMPEENLGSNELPLSATSAALLANMLRALSCESCPTYLAPILMKRSLDGTIAPQLSEYLRLRTEHLINLVRPREIVLFGDQACHNMLGCNLLSARQNKQFVNHVSSKTEAIATFHPRVLVERPEFKAEAWKDLQMLSRMSVSS